MKSKKIARIIGKKMFDPSETDVEFAFQLFVEKIVMPEGIEGYTDKDMEEWVLKALENTEE
ncbi:MAG TPA: hypothetical protein VMZ91_04485 [Candidatus Paceibacterota bacterium]|nr:hypothetical protein [Candidatus Paceibacterota bacterium]